MIVRALRIFFVFIQAQKKPSSPARRLPADRPPARCPLPASCVLGMFEDGLNMFEYDPNMFKYGPPMVEYGRICSPDMSECI